jgi:hypothetical protein
MVLLIALVLIGSPIAGFLGVIFLFDGLTRRTATGFACGNCQYELTGTMLAMKHPMCRGDAEPRPEPRGHGLPETEVAGEKRADDHAEEPFLAVRCPECGTVLNRSGAILPGRLHVSPARVWTGVTLIVAAVGSVGLFVLWWKP